MEDFKQNYFQRRTKDRGPRSNNRISSPEVQVIESDGQNLGVLSTNEAISMAKNQGLDLIEISPNANPPVCKIMDMGKFKSIFSCLLESNLLIVTVLLSTSFFPQISRIGILDKECSLIL